MFCLQESFDATTRVTLCIKRLGHKLKTMGGSQTLSEMSTRALDLCKAMAGPSTTLEELMLKDKEQVTKAIVKDILGKVGPIYKSMIELYNEMVTMTRSFEKSQGIKSDLKALNL